MEIRAKGKYLKISPKKLRLVVDLIRGRDAVEALDYLKFVPKKASLLIAKVLKSAIVNAEHNFNLKKENLFIKRIFVDQGTVLKRWQSRAFGRAAEIRKKSSHLSVVLEEKIPTSKIKPVKTKLEEPVIEALPKQEIISEKVVSQKERIKQSEVEGKKIFDSRRKGKKRAKQHLDKVRSKEAGGGLRGGLKRIFRRKSI